MTDFTNGATTPSNAKPEDKTDFSNGNQVKPEENNNKQDDPSVVLEFNGRKFTKEDLITKLSSADSFIETLKQERAQDRALLEEVNKKLAEQVSARELLNQVNSGKDKDTPAPTQTVDPEAITKQVLAQLQNQQTAKQQEQNWSEVTAKLTATFGDKTNAKVQQVAKENDMSVEEAAQLAKTKPKMFLKLFPELNGSAPKGSALLQGNSQRDIFGQPKNTESKSSGYSATRTTRDSVSVYLKRLNELSGK